MPNFARKNDAPWYVGTNGATNATRHEAQSFCLDIVTSQEYREAFRKRALAGALPPPIEALMWHHAFGKPMDNVSLSVETNGRDLSAASTEELAGMVSELQQQLDEAKQLEAAIPAEYKTETA